jgi:CRP/FNR family transcriptional regulator, cyclic AMP receptor protein
MHDIHRNPLESRVSVEILRRQRLLSSLDDSVLGGIASYVRARQFKRRDLVINCGASGAALMFLFSGRLQQIALSEDGREVGLGFIEPGEHFGLLSIIDGRPQTVSIVAVAEALVGFLDREHVENFLLRSAEVTYALLCQLCASVRQGFDDRSKLGVSSSRARIYAVLSSMVTVGRDGVAIIDKPPGHHAIAITANVSRETVTRAINLLVDCEVIRKDSGRLLVLDEKTLQLAARGELEFGEGRRHEYSSAADAPLMSRRGQRATMQLCSAIE